jgi:excisionase family DNA binding protein
MTKQLLSVEIAAQRLSISPWTIRAWIAEGRIASAKIGRRRLVPESEIERLVSDNLIPAGSVPDPSASWK